ncbi:threonine efflux protein [Rhizorhabdus dicambivorans]|uniref:Threonine efflux protein n=1 Tax=Rhizorhabdus dicambivorans TaxID=1850238 RepID=A0A2A4FWV9_9SPHN|nr:threonine efflux protein [Rhizorhabdus dicambivorans]PCE42683.1 threonine efflux protein [Rhizorhabdus dicambivorans]
MSLPIAQPQLFNTPLEAGVRALLILDAFAPQAFDLATMSLLDYYIVHTGDAGGPPSLHPEINARAGEYFVRRHLVEEGLLLMARASLVEQVFTGSGIAFRALETATAMIDLLGSAYNRQLAEAAQWLAREAALSGVDAFIENLKDGLERWSHEIVSRAADNV